MNKFLLLLVLIFLSITANANLDNKQQERYEDLSIIIPSCDAYSELWEPMLTILFKQWPSINDQYKHIPIYLVSNYEKFEHPRITNILVGEDKNWSDNFLKALEQVKTKYVLIILEDYIITKPVNDQRLAEIMQLMRKTDGAYIHVTIGTQDGPEIKGYSGITLRSHFGEYRPSLQTCIFDTNILKWLIKPGETAWDFEKKGNIRSQGIMQPFYMLTSNPVFVYRPGGAVFSKRYIKEVVDYINAQGIKFTPKKMPMINVEETGYKWNEE